MATKKITRKKKQTEDKEKITSIPITEDEQGNQTIAEIHGIDPDKKKINDPNDIDKQFDSFDPYRGEFKDIHDKTHKLPKLAFGKNRELGKIVATMLDDYEAKYGVDILKLKPHKDGSWDVENIKYLINFIADFAMEKIGEIVAIIVGKDAKWVDEHMEEETVAMVVMNFFGKKKIMGQLILSTAISGFGGRATS